MCGGGDLCGYQLHLLTVPVIERKYTTPYKLTLKRLSQGVVGPLGKASEPLSGLCLYAFQLVAGSVLTWLQRLGIRGMRTYMVSKQLSPLGFLVVTYIHNTCIDCDITALIVDGEQGSDRVVNSLYWEDAIRRYALLSTSPFWLRLCRRLHLRQVRSIKKGSLSSN